MQIKSKKKLKILSFGIALALPLGLFGGVMTSETFADQQTNLTDYSTPVTVNNGNFTANGNEAEENITSWTKIIGNGGQTWVINTGDTFSTNATSYALTNNPGSPDGDNRVLMFNSITSIADKGKGLEANIGYKNDIALDANAYYSISVDVMTSLDTPLSEAVDSNARASIYISGLGLTDDEGGNIKLGYENIQTNDFETYTFYIATGSEAKNVSLDLYLGNDGGLKSTGVAFFDNVTMTQYAEKTFFKEVPQNTDVLGVDAQQTKCVISALKEKDDATATILGEDYEKYNFNFENTSASDDENETVGQGWTLIEGSGDAKIQSLTEETRFGVVGDDLSYDIEKGANKYGLVLTANNGYVKVQSRPIAIKAHGLYKFTIKAKSLSLDKNFNIIFKENDQIYTNHNIGEDNYTLAEATKTGSASDKGDSYTNDYTTLTYYIKGHDYYDSSINIQLALGESGAEATGLVAFDNIKVELVDNQTYTDASSSDKLELKAYDDTIKSTLNGDFNKAYSEANNLTYPLTADVWEVAIEDTKADQIKNGVLYLNKNDKTQQKMYQDTLGFGIPEGLYTKSVNNIFMMQNRVKTYQSIKSASYSLPTDSNFHKISFDFKTEGQPNIDSAHLAVEVVDANGLRLFYKDGLSNNNSFLQPFEIELKTDETISSSINVIIHFGEANDKLAQGLAFIDNFAITSSATTFGTPDSYDLTGFFLDLDGETGENYVKNTAYTFSSTNSEASDWGVLNGAKNSHKVYNSSNILGISNYGMANSTLESKFSLNVNKDSTENARYKLSFELYTNEERTKDTTPTDHECNYGVSVGLSNYKLIEGLTSKGKFTTFEIYYSTSTASTSTFKFALQSDCGNNCEDIRGSAYLANIRLTKATDLEYNNAVNNNTPNAFVATEIVETPSTPDDDTEDNNTASTDQPDTLWLTIPSIIFGVSILIAVGAYIFSKINIKKKKSDKVNRESYDKKKVNRDEMLIKAQEQRDNEADEIRKQISATEARIAELETEHKEMVKASRDKTIKLTKNDEKDFKTYANKIARLYEKTEILKEQLELTLSDEYLISIESKLAQEEQAKIRELEKLSKPAKEPKENDDTSSTKK